jgi:hypothetical protein
MLADELLGDGALVDELNIVELGPWRDCEK